MSLRRRFNQTVPLKDRLAAFISAMQERAEIIPPGPERDEILKKIRQAETASAMEDWAMSPGLQSPK